MIAVDVTPLALGRRRGVARALLTLLGAWAERSPGSRVRLFSPGPLPPDVPTLDGVVTPKRPVTSPRAFRRRLGRMVEGEGADVLYVPWSAFPRTQVPVVATVHELPFVRLGPVEGRIRTWNHRYWLRKNVRSCAGIVVPTQAVRDDVLRLHPAAKNRVHVVGCGFDPLPWRQAARDVARAPWPRVVVVGTGDGEGGARKKGLDVLFAALPRAGVHALRTVIVGDVTGEVPKDVEVRREPDDASLARLLASAHVLVHPARSEGFGYPPLEAMASGTPVVTSDGGALPEVVGDAALVVPAGDADALADAIHEMVGNGNLRIQMLRAGRARVRAFDPAGVAGRLAMILRRAKDGR